MIPPVRIAHRGGSGYAPENTLAAFEQAIQIGVDVIEADVQVTKDGELVVIHDATLDRTTDRYGLISEMSLEEIRQADAGSWFDGKYQRERIPTLQEVLELARRRALVLIELKSDSVAEKLLGVVESMGASAQVIVQSFNPETIRRLNLLDPSLSTALLVGQLPTTPSRVRARRLISQLLSVGANALSVWHATLTPSFFEEMRKRAVAVWTWTVNEEIVMRDMVLMGVHGVITDYPDRLNLALDGLEQEGMVQPPLGRRRSRARKSRWGRRWQIKQRRLEAQSRSEASPSKAHSASGRSK